MENEKVQADNKRLQVSCKLVARLQAENEKLTAENAKLRESQRWIAVSERLPEEGQKFYIRDGEPEDVTAKYEPSHNSFYPWLRTDLSLAFRRSKDNVTDWRPLPDPPQKGE